MVLQLIPTKKEPVVTWEKLPEDFILPDEPVENIQQSSLAAALTDALGTSDHVQPQMLIASFLRSRLLLIGILPFSIRTIASLRVMLNFPATFIPVSPRTSFA